MPIEQRIRWAAVLISAGLLIQLATLIWNHPLSFMVFILIGCPLMVAGVFWFLFSLVAGADA